MLLKIGKCKIEIIQGNLASLQEKVDALVSSDDNYLTAGGGVSKALIVAAASPLVREEMRNHVQSQFSGSSAKSALTVGDAVLTSAGHLNAAHIIHGIVIDFDRNILPDRNIVRQTVLRSLELSARTGIRSLAFPLFGSGSGLLNKRESATGICQGIFSYLRASGTLSPIQRILLVSQDANGVNALTKALAANELSFKEESQRKENILGYIRDEFPLPIAIATYELDSSDYSSEGRKALIIFDRALRYIATVVVACLNTLSEKIDIHSLIPRSQHYSLGKLMDIIGQIAPFFKGQRWPIPELGSLIGCSQPDNSRSAFMENSSQIISMRNQYAHAHSGSQLPSDIWDSLIPYFESISFIKKYPLFLNDTALMGHSSSPEYFNLIKMPGSQEKSAFTIKSSIGLLELSPWINDFECLPRYFWNETLFFEYETYSNSLKNSSLRCREPSDQYISFILNSELSGSYSDRTSSQSLSEVSIETPTEAAGRANFSVVRLQQAILQNLTPQSREFLENKFTSLKMTGRFEDVLIEYCLEKDPVEILNELFSSPDLLRMIKQNQGDTKSLNDLQLHNKLLLCQKLLVLLNFRELIKPRGISTIRDEVVRLRSQLDQSTELETVRGCVMDLGRKAEEVLRSLIRFYGVILLPTPLETSLRDLGWNESGKPIGLLTLGQLLDVIDHFELAIKEEPPSELALHFRELFPGRNFLGPLDDSRQSLFLKVRNDIVHYRKKAETQDVFALRNFASNSFTVFSDLLDYLISSEVFPRVLTIRRLVEDSYGRRFIEAEDDRGRTEKIFTDQALESGHCYMMHPTTNPVRIFPILVRLT